MFNFSPVLIFSLVAINIVNSQSYRAGVVIYKPVDPAADLTPDEHVKENTMSYVELINQNANQVDILVFPEYGITNIRAKDKAKEHLSLFSTAIGNVNDIVCKKNRSEENLVKLSCAAKDKKMYVIVNLVEKDADNYYSTTIGLDPTGSLCLKCRKYHSNGTNFEKTPDQLSCKFTAKLESGLSVPFTVLFGTDLVYAIPTDIKNENVIVTSSIKNILPLNIGFNLYQGFALSNGVNLLVSGYYEKNSNTVYDNYGGSGIYYGNGTSRVAFRPNGADQEFGKGLVLKSEVPVKTLSTLTPQVQCRIEGEIPKMNLQYMTIPSVNDTNKSVELCLDPKKCCKFKAELTEDSIAPYKWIILSNKTIIMDQEIDIFLCAIVGPSANALPKSFKNLTISSNIDRSKTNQNLPMALGPNLSPSDFMFNKDSNTVMLSKEGSIVAFGIMHALNPDSAESDFNRSGNLLLLISSFGCCYFFQNGFLKIWI